jgi:predicted CoA-binding protein
MHNIVRIAEEIPRVLKTVRQNRLTVIWVQEGRGNRRWRKLHGEEIHDLYSSPNIVRVIK